jgi:hypothetical protein
LVVHGALRLAEDPEAGEAELHSLAGSGSMWPTMRPPPLSPGDREPGAGQESTGSMKPASQSTGAGWRASHGPVTPPASVLPPSFADDDEAPTPLLLTRVRSSPPPAPTASGSSIAPVYYTDAPPPAQGDLASDGRSWTGLLRTAPAWALPLVSAASASALTLVVLGWSSTRTPPTEPATIAAPTSAGALLAAAAAPSTDAPSPGSIGSHPDFDRAGAEAALERAAARAANCPGPRTPRAIDVRVTFTPAGTVSRALVLDSRLLGTPRAACVMSAFHRARIPPFPEPAVTLQRGVRLGSPD